MSCYFDEPNVSDDEITKLDNRERYYNRIEINKELIEFNYTNFQLNTDDIVYVYYVSGLGFRL